MVSKRELGKSLQMHYTLETMCLRMAENIVKNLFYELRMYEDNEILAAVKRQ